MVLIEKGFCPALYYDINDNVSKGRYAPYEFYQSSSSFVTTEDVNLICSILRPTGMTMPHCFIANTSVSE